MSNNAPFAVGQRVVYLGYTPKYERNDPVDILSKGKVYRVTECFCDSGYWYIGVDGDSVWAYIYEAFAPYDPPAIEIPAELLKEPVNETSDVLTVKEITHA